MLVHGEKPWSGEAKSVGASSSRDVRSRAEEDGGLAIGDYETSCSRKFMVEGGGSKPVTAGAA